jgi:archaellum biogenesis ATPase FlaH
MSDRIELVILRHLLHDAPYRDKVLSYMQPKDFAETNEGAILAEIKAYHAKYSASPSNEQLVIALDARPGVSDEECELAAQILDKIGKEQCPANNGWLLDETEKWIAERRRNNFVLDMIHGLEKKQQPTPEEFADSMNFSFNQSVGLDFFADARCIHQCLTSDAERFPFAVQPLNDLTGGGVTRKTLNIVLAPTNVGKSLLLCNFTADYMRQGRAVLYVTLEMSRERTAERVAANLLDTEISNLRKCTAEEFQRAMAGAAARFSGKLVIEEFPASTASASQFRRLLQDLAQKKKFVPDVMAIDYLNLCSPISKAKSISGGSYDAVGAVVKELRGLAMEKNIVLWTATQTNRSGYRNADVGLEHTSESYAVNSTADLILGLSRDDASPSTLKVKILKQRNEGSTGTQEIILGVNPAKMRVHEVDPADHIRKVLAAKKPSRKSTVEERVAKKTPQFAYETDSDGTPD